MIGVVGLGLIGGSLAKALNENTDYTIYGFDKDPVVNKKAKLVNAIEGILTDEILSACDIVIVSLYPHDTVAYIREKAHLFKKDAIILDCGGVKSFVCNEIAPISQEHGFTFIGGHPMAGMEHSGFSYSKKALFNQASMVLVPIKGTPIEPVEKVKNLCHSIGFTNIQITNEETHDQIIAFTSQLAHVVSSAYIKSPTAEKHKGFSAGSYKDLTRVAKLNAAMWSELFLENKENLVFEIDEIVNQLLQYKKAIETDNASELQELLSAGNARKIEIDKETF